MGDLLIEKSLPLIRRRLHPRVQLGSRVTHDEYGEGIIGAFMGASDRVERFYVDYGEKRVSYTPREIAELIFGREGER